MFKFRNPSDHRSVGYRNNFRLKPLRLNVFNPKSKIYLPFETISNSGTQRKRIFFFFFQTLNNVPTTALPPLLADNLVKFRNPSPMFRRSIFRFAQYLSRRAKKRSRGGNQLDVAQGLELRLDVNHPDKAA